MRRGIAVALLIAAVAMAAAEGGERVPPIADPVVKKECGSCHLAFPPQFLPRRSWQKLVDTLADHFGENADLGEAQRKAVLDYLLANAADGPKAGRQGRKFVEGIPATQTPLRITETPRWVKEHREVRAARWGDPKVKSKANCVACHTAAEQGLYDD
jgi:mono/diheme cytochrome c family protein